MTPRKAEDDIAAVDALVAKGGELEGVVRVDAAVARIRRDVFSLRIGSDELVEVAEAAAAKGQNVGEFIRDAAINAARSGQREQWLSAPVAQALDELVRQYGAQKAGQRRRRRSKASA
jgi:uncharacterized protein (DUF1778 family)